MDIWDKYFFHDCPGPAVLCADFAAGLTAAIAQKAAKDAKVAQEAESSRCREHEVVVDPLLTAPAYKADS